jgi:hypothetical protein
MKDRNLIFLISLPRSGSTLLQRMLATSPYIDTVSEPWLLLPLSSLIEGDHTLAMYNHNFAHNAIEDFIQSLPNKHIDFYQALETFVLSLYSNKSLPNTAKYFLDKTPRYYIIIKFLSNAFPSAKFIFLFRNPLEVLASVVSTWLNNKLFLYRYFIDLYAGPHALAEGYEGLKDRAVRVNYHDLISLPNVELRRICSFLNIQFDPFMTTNFTNILLNGRMGDKEGINIYSHIDTEPLRKWKEILNTSYRKFYARRYIKHLGDKTLSHFGTNEDEMAREISSIQNIRSGSFVDLFYHTTSIIKRWVLVDYYKHNHPFSKNKTSYYPYL